MNKKLLMLSLLISVTAFSTTTQAQQNTPGRYQATLLPDPTGGYAVKVLIVDTKEGNLWVWQDFYDQGTGDRALGTVYQGKLVPGTKMGDLIAGFTYPGRQGK